jgi:hypothetical protein
MAVAAHIADGGERLALPQLRYPLQQVTALGGVRLHYRELLLGQRTGFVEDFRGNGPLAYIMEQASVE